MSTKDKIKLLAIYNEGSKTLQQMANMHGISRQRVWQILKSDHGLIRRSPNAMTIVHKPYEDIFEQQLIDKGIFYEKQPYNAPFDFIVECKKIEVKYLEKKKNGHKIFKFNNVKSTELVDYYVFITKSVDVSFYIVPAEKVTKYVSIPVNPKWSKYLEYKNRWDQIIKE